MSNGMYCSASHWIESASSASLMRGTAMRLMITDGPETEVAKALLRTPVRSISRWIASTASVASATEPSTIASGGSGSRPTLSSLYPPLRSFSSTSLTAELPMSSPTTFFEREKSTSS